MLNRINQTGGRCCVGAQISDAPSAVLSAFSSPVTRNLRPVKSKTLLTNSLSGLVPFAAPASPAFLNS